MCLFGLAESVLHRIPVGTTGTLLLLLHSSFIHTAIVMAVAYLGDGVNKNPTTVVLQCKAKRGKVYLRLSTLAKTVYIYILRSILYIHGEARRGVAAVRLVTVRREILILTPKTTVSSERGQLVCASCVYCTL